MSTLLDIIKVEVADDENTVRLIVERVMNWDYYAESREQEKKIFLLFFIILVPLLWVFVIDFIFISVLKNAIMTQLSIAAIIICLMAISIFCFLLRSLYFEFKTKLLLWEIMRISQEFYYGNYKIDTIVHTVNKQLDEYWRKE